MEFLSTLAKMKGKLKKICKYRFCCAVILIPTSSRGMGVGIILSTKMPLRELKREFISLKDIMNLYVRDSITNDLDFGVTKT